MRISGSDGKILARRLQPRAAFKGLRRLLYWDALDFIYFGGYATWNYLVAPFLFLRDGFQFELLESPPDPSLPWVRLGATLPQDFKADESSARAENAIKAAEERERMAAEKERAADEKAAKAEAAFQKWMRKEVNVKGGVDFTFYAPDNEVAGSRNPAISLSII